LFFFLPNIQVNQNLDIYSASDLYLPISYIYVLVPLSVYYGISLPILIYQNNYLRLVVQTRWKRFNI